MGIEDRPAHVPAPDPPEEEDAEMSFYAALRNAVDELFARQVIAERLRGTEGNEQIESFTRHWKETLAQQFEETANLAVEHFLADLDAFQASAEPHRKQREACQHPDKA